MLTNMEVGPVGPGAGNDSLPPVSQMTEEKEGRSKGRQCSTARHWKIGWNVAAMDPRSHEADVQMARITSALSRFLSMNDFEYVLGDETGGGGEDREKPLGNRHLQTAVRGKKKFRPSEFRLVDEDGSEIPWNSGGGWKPMSKGETWEKMKSYAAKDGKVTANTPYSVRRPLQKVTIMDLRRKRQRDIAFQFDEWSVQEQKWGNKIYWYWEPKGLWGKSTLVRYFVDQKNARMCGGSGADTIYALGEALQENTDVSIVVFNIARASFNRVPWAALESIKDGVMFNQKYKSGQVRFNIPHLLIFSNFPPPEELTNHMTEDKLIVERLTEEEETRMVVYASRGGD